MYFAGIYIHEKPNQCTAVIVEKILRNARKEYGIQDIRLLPSPEKTADLISEIRDLYQDPCFLRKKKVFSQDRRPSKNTFTPPLLVMAEMHHHPSVIQGLRDAHIPVDGFYFQNDDGWQREDLKILRFGCNLHVNRADMGKLEKILVSDSALTMDKTLDHAASLEEEKARCLAFKKTSGIWPDVFQEEGFRFLPALFLSLWHCESIKQIKRY